MHASVDVTDGLSVNDAHLLPFSLHIVACIALLCVRSPALLYPATVHLDSCSFAYFCKRIGTHLVQIFSTLDYIWKFSVCNVKSENNS